MISDLSLLVFKRHEPSPSVIWMCRMHATKLYRVTVLTKFQWLIDWLSHALPRLPIHGTSSSEGIISIHGCLPCLFGRHGISSRIVHVTSRRPDIDLDHLALHAEHGIASSRPCPSLVPCNAYGRVVIADPYGPQGALHKRFCETDLPSQRSQANKQDRGLVSTSQTRVRRPTQPDGKSIECMLVLLWL